jgi:hypothetical protein
MKPEAIQNLEHVQQLFGELEFTLTRTGYYKDYGLANGTTVRIVPMFDKGVSLDMRYDLSAISVAGNEIIPIVAGRQIAFDKIPAECREDVLRILAELAPGALISKKESFILTMICTKCRKEISSYLSIKGVVKCLKCAGYKL